MPSALIVDDAAFVRLTLKDVLLDAGFETMEAENGSVAVKKYSEFRPDVVLMDITMPEKGGLAATKEILQVDPDAKVIMVSASGQEATVKEAIRAGAKDFIVKPFSHERVMEALTKVLQ